MEDEAKRQVSRRVRPLERMGVVRTRWWRMLVPWSASLGVHGLIVGSAVFVVWSVVPVSTPVPPAIVSFENPSPSPIAMPVLPEETMQDRAALPELPELRASRVPAMASVRFERLAGEIHGERASRALAVKPEDRRVAFAGLGASDARDIVYVIDVSASMLASFPEVRRALVRSIVALHPTQRFQIVLMRAAGEGAVVAPIPSGVPRPILLDATRELKREAFEWLFAVKPVGRGTSDLHASLRQALSFVPDAVFVLGSITTADLLDLEGTPQEQRNGLLAWLDGENPRDGRTGARRISIQTLQYVEDDPTGIMRRIGIEHGGSAGYRYLTLDDLVQEEES